jgi:hypothetical protein
MCVAFRIKGYSSWLFCPGFSVLITVPVVTDLFCSFMEPDLKLFALRKGSGSENNTGSVILPRFQNYGENDCLSIYGVTDYKLIKSL